MVDALEMLFFLYLWLNGRHDIGRQDIRIDHSRRNDGILDRGGGRDVPYGYIT